MLLIGAARDDLLAGAGAFAGTVFPLRRTGRTLGCVAVELHEHGVVDIGPEGALDRLKIRLVPVGGELHALAEPAGEVSDELFRGLGVSSADVPARDDLSVRAHGNPQPHVAVPE